MRFLCFFSSFTWTERTQPTTPVAKSKGDESHPPSPKRPSDVSTPGAYTLHTAPKLLAVPNTTFAPAFNSNILRKRNICAVNTTSAVNTCAVAASTGVFYNTRNRTTSVLTSPPNQSFINSSLFGARKAKIHPEEFRPSFDRSSSRDSSESDSRNALQTSFKNEEKSQLICYTDNNKVITIKNDSKLTKYNTFEMNLIDKKRSKLMKFKSLDEPSQQHVKYYDPDSNISISAEDFNSDYKRMKFVGRKQRADVICDTVDSWAKKGSKNVFSSLKSSIFHHKNDGNKGVVFKPLVFGGTFPIDEPECLRTPPLDQRELISPEIHLPISKFNEMKQNKSGSADNVMLKLGINDTVVMRKYGPAKSFDIDLPI